MKRRLHVCLFLVTTLSSIDSGLGSPQTWNQDCQNPEYAPTTQTSLTFLQDEYRRKFGPRPVHTPNTVTESEISFSEDPTDTEFLCGTRSVNVEVDENFTGAGTDESRFPWIVAVRGSKYFCAGVVLTVNFVLSPVRCVDPSSKVFLGNKNRKNFTSKTQIRHTIANYFNNAIKIFQHGFDIGLIKMDKPVEYSDIIRPICMPRAGSQFHFYNCYLLNWGRYDPVRKELSDDLLVMSAELMEAYECQFRYKLAQIKVNESEACLAFKEKMGAVNKCSVDTGGPVICEVKGKYFVAALSSHVESGCTNRLLPDIFTKVAMFENWIVEKVFIK